MYMNGVQSTILEPWTKDVTGEQRKQHIIELHNNLYSHKILLW